MKVYVSVCVLVTVCVLQKPQCIKNRIYTNSVFAHIQTKMLF